MKHTKLKKNESGAVAIFTVIFIAIILGFVTISFVRLAVREQRQSTDNDLSTRALYAADSGIEDARRALQIDNLSAAALNGDNCDPPAGYENTLSDSGGLGSSYSCLLIDPEVEEFQSALSPNSLEDTAHIPLRPVTGEVATVEISWHFPAETPETPRSTSNRELPPDDQWGNTPAMLRTNFFSHPSTGGSNRADLIANNFTGFLNPTDAGTVPTLDTVANIDHQIQNASCDSSSLFDGAYMCRANITGFAVGRSHYLRLKTLYQATNVQVRMFDSSGNPLRFDEVQAKVDVTGQAGDVFRRLEARIPLQDRNLLPDYAVLSADHICKEQTLTPAAGTNTCPTP